MLTRVKAAIAGNLRRGENQKSFADIVNEEFDKAGVTRLRPFHLETVYRTNTALAYSGGQISALDAVKDDFPLWRYSAVKDSRTRPSHRALDGKLFKTGDYTYYPPISFNCRCEAIPLSRAEAQSLSPSNLPADLEATLGKTEFIGNKNQKFLKWLEQQNLSKEAKEKIKSQLKTLIQTTEKTGLAQRIQVKSYKDFSKIMETFHTETPDWLLDGFKSITIKKTSEYFMATIPKKGEFFISNRTFLSKNFNPAKALKRALQKIYQNKPLSFNEEYAIEGLWHEILHNRAKGKYSPFINQAQRTIMETLNQFTARNTYDFFLEKLGAQASHKQLILDEGMGYSTSVKNFNLLLNRLSINKKEQLESLFQINYNANWNEIDEILIQFLHQESGISKSKIKLLLFSLNKNENENFEDLLNSIL